MKALIKIFTLCWCILKIEMATSTILPIMSQIRKICPVIVDSCLNNDNCRESINCFEKCQHTNLDCKKDCFFSGITNKSFFTFQLCIGDFLDQKMPNTHEIEICSECNNEIDAITKNIDASYTFHCIDECNNPSNDKDKIIICSSDCIAEYNTIDSFTKIFWCRAGCKISKIMENLIRSNNPGDDL